MKTIEFETPNGLLVSFMPDKLGIIKERSSIKMPPLGEIIEVTDIFVAGDESCVMVKGSYEETIKRIREL